MKQLITWFANLSFSGKLLVILAFGWVVTYQVMSIQLSLANKALMNQIIEEKTIVEEKIFENEQTQDSIINTAENKNTVFQKEIQAINLKSKQDAEKIDNTDYSMSKLDSLLASYD